VISDKDDLKPGESRRIECDVELDDDHFDYTDEFKAVFVVSADNHRRCGKCDVDVNSVRFFFFFVSFMSRTRDEDNFSFLPSFVHTADLAQVQFKFEKKVIVKKGECAKVVDKSDDFCDKFCSCRFVCPHFWRHDARNATAVLYPSGSPARRRTTRRNGRSATTTSATSGSTTVAARSASGRSTRFLQPLLAYPTY
jgi:hypothetical protein